MDLEKYNTVFKYIVNKIKNYDTSDVPLDIGIEYYTFEEHFFSLLVFKPTFIKKCFSL